MIKLKRIYEKPEDSDGYRVLVDRLWPRGVSREKAHLDLWLKEIAPTNELRKWFGHEPYKWEDFNTRYKEELVRNQDAVSRLKRLAGERTVTLLYATKDNAHNAAIVIKDFIENGG